ncbi:MAG: ribonuclease P protein component 1 [Candidatus Diapherotrites archaeon]
MQENYGINEKNLLAHELIGLKARVSESNCKERIGIEGTIVDETKNTFKLETKKGETILPKKECIFEFSLPKNKKATVKGKTLCFRPEDRIKEYWRKAI